MRNEPDYPYSGHFHVGHNIPGYLPESDVGCFDDLDNALEHLRSELNSQSDAWYENVDDRLADQGRADDDPWGSVANDVYADAVKISDGDMKPHAIRDQGVSLMYVPPEGADLHYWLHFAEGPQDECELNEEDDLSPNAQPFEV